VAGTSAKVQIRGLQLDEHAMVVQELNEQEDVTFFVQENGDHELNDCNYVRVVYEGANRGFIACVLIGG
jgi:hypothetical protein